MIKFDDVTKRFPNGTFAVRNLNLEIPAGKITVLVGTSGCGKTTTLRMINRMVEPTGGRILVDGRDVREADPPTLRRGIGYVIQQAGLFPHRKILDNVCTVPYLLGMDRRKARARAMELLERVHLTPAKDYAKRYPFELSGGQQQRVGVARALAADPPVLLMDEPFSAVDPVVRKELQTELLRLQEELHKTVVFVTHDIDEAITLGDMIGVFRVGGGLVQFDTPSRLLAAPVDDFVRDFLGADRGIKRLSFLAATGVNLTAKVSAGRDTPVDAARAAAAHDAEWLLVVDAQNRPVGWAPVATLPAGGTVGDMTLAPLGRVFSPDRDSLRIALDCAVLSPAGYAVAVDADGRLLGTATHVDIAAAIRAAERHDDDAAAPGGRAT